MTPYEKMTFDYLSNPAPISPDANKIRTAQESFVKNLLGKVFEWFDE